MADPIELVCCYSSDDEKGLQALLNHLKPLERTGEIRVWHDRQIEIGSDRYQAIQAHMERAQVILLLISSSFLASDYSYSQEMQRALERQWRNEAHVIPIILRPCNWRITPIGQLQALPDDGKPIGSWDNDLAFLNVTEGIQDVVRRLRVKILLREADDLAQKWQRFEALSAYEQALVLQQTMQPLDAEQRTILALICQGKADVFFALGRYEEASQNYGQALANDSALVHSNEYRGRTLLILRRPEQALPYLQQAIRQEPGNKDVAVDLVEALLALKREREAMACCEQIFARFPKSFRLQKYAAELFQKFGKYEQALSAWENVILIESEDTTLLTVMNEYVRQKAEVLVALQRYDEALSAYRTLEMSKRIEGFNKDDAPIFLSQGQLLSRLWRHEEALAAYDEALKLDPQLAEAHFGQRSVYEVLAQKYLVLARQSAVKEQDYHGQFKRMYTLRAHTSRISRIELSPDGGTLASASYDGEIRLWDLASNLQSRVLDISTEALRDLAFSPDGSLIATCWEKGKVTLWDSITARECFTLHNEGITSLAFSPGDQHLISGCLDGSVKIWNRSGQHLATFPVSKSEITRIALRPTGDFMACADLQETTIMFHTLSGKTRSAPIEYGRQEWNQLSQLWSLFFSPNGQMLLGAGNEAVQIWDISSIERVSVLVRTTKQAPLQCCTLSGNGRWLAYGAFDYKICLIHLTSYYKHQMGSELVLHTGSVRDLALSHNGRMLVAGLDDGTIEIWMRE